MPKISNSNIFLDANVTFDYVLRRERYLNDIERVFNYAQKYSVTLYVCSFTFAIAYYYARNQKKMPHLSAVAALDDLFSKVKCIPVDGGIIQKAIKSKFKDYEDAIQYCCAMEVPECEAIITRNTKDFELSSIPVTTPQKFLTKINHKSTV